MASAEAEFAPDEQPDGMTAEQILKRMSEVYVSCTSYEDAGVVESLAIREGQRLFQIKPFITVFERTGRFCFEYTQGEKRHIVWTDGNRVKTWSNTFHLSLRRLNPVGLLFLPVMLAVLLFAKLFHLYACLILRQSELGMALAGATGVSGGSAHIIPALLLPDEVGGQRLTNIIEATRIEDRMLEGVACYCIQGKLMSQSMLLWIDHATFLVRRIDQQATYKEFYIEETTTYYPIANQPIVPEKFVFRPSRKQTD